MSKQNDYVLRSKRVREQLTRDLPSLPAEVAIGASTYLLTILTKCWLDCDDRIAEREQADDC